jgi:hypothetical protein
MKRVLKSFLLLVISFCIVEKVSGQDDIDAIRYSQTSLAVTARSLSMAGAFGALGADFSSLSTNPAGIAFYRKSEFTFTPGIEDRVTTTNYLGKNSQDNKSNFFFGNIGFVWAYPKENKKSDWKGFAFGLGYNRLSSYHSRNYYEGVNKNNSLLDSYAEEAMGQTTDNVFNNYPYSSGLAYEAYAIDVYADDTTNYFSMIPNGGELQRRTTETTGSNGEFVISFGGNYNNKIYWGATLGFPNVHFHEDIFYEERDVDNTIQFDSTGGNAAYANLYNFKSFLLSETKSTHGYGFNAKFGLIFRPVDMLRFGIAFHTPTYYNMHDEYITSMTTNFENGNSYSFDSPFGTYDYELTTPFRLMGSAALIFKQHGIFSVDYEFVDYTTAKLHAYDYAFADENSVIRNSYTQQNNIKAGVEWKYGIFAFRGGAGYSTGVLKSSVSSTNTDQHKIIYSGGIGVREEAYFVDFGYSYTQSNEFYRPYTLTYEPVEGAFSKIKDHQFLLTVGFRF